MGKRKLAKEIAKKPAPRKKTSWTVWGIAGGVAVIVLGVVGYMAYEAGQAAEAKVGKPAPDFTLKLVNGQSVMLSALQGKPVLINFWASA